MSKTCMSCGRDIGFFSGENVIAPGSARCLCDKCYAFFGVEANKVKALDNASEVRDCYQNACRLIRNSGLRNQEAILAELEKLYTSKMDAIAQSSKDASITAEELAQAHEQEKREEAAKKRAMAQMLITSGFQFDGYRIVKYSGYISGDDAIQVARATWFGGTVNVGEALMDSLVKIRRKALQELKEAAYELGCNAVIGVDFDYITLEPEKANFNGGTTYLPYVFGVTANGNAVVIEKIEDDAPRPAADYGAPRRRNTLRPSDFE
ncbi:MAG: heavy metal-binding domain-containing protein [Clostridia bacterium]|nr:heavy metal-binding domain-containing protein [Clostridia bacterium]